MQDRRVPLAIVAVLGFEIVDAGVSHVIDEVDLAGAECRQTHGIFAFGSADNTIQIRQLIALGIRFPVVLKALEPSLGVPLPRNVLEGSRANWVI